MTATRAALWGFAAGSFGFVLWALVPFAFDVVRSDFDASAYVAFTWSGSSAALLGKLALEALGAGLALSILSYALSAATSRWLG